MKVLFVASGNSRHFSFAPFILEQGGSLEEAGVEVTCYSVKGRGLIGYLKNIRRLRKFMETNEFDVVHAHFTLSALIAVLTFTKLPVIVSFMGSDVFGRIVKIGNWRFSNSFLSILTAIIQPFVDAIVIKSPNMEKYIWKKGKMFLVPNGVDFKKF